MESYEHKEALKKMNKEKNTLCKNAEVSLGEKFEVLNTGCPNHRRNGSAWCQECSDKHKK